MKASQLVVVSLFALAAGSLSLGGCDSSQPGSPNETPLAAKSAPDEAPNQARGEGADKATGGAGTILYDEGEPVTDDTLLARGDGLEVTVGDYDLAVRRSLLFAPLMPDGTRIYELSPEQLATPHMHIAVSQSLVSRKLIMSEAAAREITITPEEVRTFLQSHDVLSRYAHLHDDAPAEDPVYVELQAMGLDVEDLRVIAREELTADRLQGSLLRELTDDMLWHSYKHSQDTVDLLAVASTNTPSSKELDAFLSEDAGRSEPRIDAFFKANPQRFTFPATVQLTLLKAPTGQGGPELAEKLQQAARRLESGEEPQSTASGLGLTLETDVAMVRDENRRAFDAKTGSTGFETSGPRGPHVWRVEGMNKPRPLELTRPVRREIAAELLREQGVVPNVRERLQPAIEALSGLPAVVGPEQISALEEQLSGARLQVIHTGSFPVAGDGFIPKIGLAEEVAEAARALSKEEPVSPLVASRGRVFVIRLLDSARASRAQFEKDKDSFREAYVEQRGSHIVQEYITKLFDEKNVEIEAGPLRVKYGVVQKE